MKFYIKDFFSKCFYSFLRIWSHSLKKSLIENFRVVLFRKVVLYSYIPKKKILQEMFSLILKLIHGYNV